MHHYLLYHRHPATDCTAHFAAWNGFASELRGTDAWSSCAFGGHELWWSVAASDASAALELLPPFVARRTQVVRVGQVTIP